MIIPCSRPFYFCKLIGFRDCPYNAVGSLMESGCKELITHLLEVHPEIQQTSINAGRWLQLNYDNFLCRASTTVASKNNLEKGSTVIWEPHLVTLRETIVLLLLCQISAETRNAAWICLRMTDECGEEDDDRSNIAIQYQIGGEDTNDGTNESIFLAPELTCTAPTMSFKNIEKDLENYALRIPLCVLTSLNFETGNDSKNGKNRGLLRMRVKVGEKSLRNVDGDYDKLNLAEKSGKKVEQMMPVAIKELTQVISTLSVVRQEGNGNGENNRSPDDGATGGEIVFENIYCNSCGARPVTKIRYKCLQCIDFDLCRMCMERRTHSHHVFARIQDLRQNDFFNWKHRLGLIFLLFLATLMLN